jgi:cob(I)alamin adenosyltransferase
MNPLPIADESIKGRQGFGLIQVFTGNGKGKTTAATGEMIRAIGAGKKVGIVYFDKGGESHYFERSVLRNLGVDLIATGRDRIDPVTNRFDFSISDLDKTEAARGLVEVQRMFEAEYDVVVLDEINSTVDLGMISVEAVLALLEKKPETTELVLTGRNAPQAFLDKAHLMTEMKLHKHYFYSGVKAREGLDY